MQRRLRRRFPEIRTREQPASGAKLRKGDIAFGEYIIECKATAAGSYSIKAETMNKARNDAMAHGKVPLLAIQLSDGRTYWVVEDGIMLDLLEAEDGTDSEG